MKTMNLKIKLFYSTLIIITGLLACNNNKEIKAPLIEDIAANDDVARYMEAFKGLGALTDSTKPTQPDKALNNFRLPDDLIMDLILSEPDIVQPVELSFDHRGRLWVVQYHQYPYPLGLKVTSVDNFLRVRFDKVPVAPPGGLKGADKISIFEDTDGNGTYDKSTVAIEGLNIATSVLTGRGKIWVLNPPYLLSYDDFDSDGLPDGEPKVHLSGFGLEDTHAVANSLRWGPDGWLYGAQGSTTTANISSSVSKNIAFSGQVIWRYNIDTKVFEVFAEGGGNTFNVEFDSKGRLYSGNNGSDRGPYYKQGGYYPRSLGKHGPYTNPYTFGNLDNMELEGEKIRFTHSLIRYEGGELPEVYEGKMIAVNPLLNYVQLSRFEPKGSSFKNIDERKIIETNDHWFRPVNIKAGPDGAVYIADWYDSRLSHVDPRDTWHKSSGRIYRLRAKGSKTAFPSFDLSKLTNSQLIEQLGNKNKWFRQQTLLQFANRKDKSIVPRLIDILKSDNPQLSLEALWAINASGGFNDELARIGLSHSDKYVREWTVRLIGDKRKISSAIAQKLATMAAIESSSSVRSQLAATAKRISGIYAIPILKNLIKNHDDSDDPDIPLLIWWAVESKSESDRDAMISVFEDKVIWQRKLVQEFLLKRLMQRYIMSAGDANYNAASKLIQLAPDKLYVKILISGLREGLRGKDVIGLSAELTKAIQPYQSDLFGSTLALSIRQGNQNAVKKALNIIANDNADLDQRLSLIMIFGQTNEPQSIPVLLKITESGKSTPAMKEAALHALQRYNSDEIGLRVVKAYPQFRGDIGARNAAMDLFASRSNWANQLFIAIRETKRISKDDVSDQIARRLKLLNDTKIIALADQLWPNVKISSSSEKNAALSKYSSLIKSGSGNVTNGRILYLANCGYCHKLFNEGGNVGPELTGYERTNTNYFLLNIIDPNADIREGYGLHKLVTTDGRTLEGKITSSNGDTHTIQTQSGKEIILSIKQIKEMKALPISIMPERILDRLNDQEVRDLFAYIMKKN
jgi:putative heme-binding domain-containing protein